MVEAIRTHGAALDSSDMGTGKTVKAVEVSKTLGLAPLVVCPKTVIASWDETLQGQNWQAWDILTWEKVRTGNTRFLDRRGKKGFDWTLAPEDSLLIFDEVHKAKGTRTLNANMLIAAKRQGYKVLMLSATAAEDPREMRALGYTLNLHNLKNYWNWAKDWGCKFDNWGSLQFPESSKEKLKDLNKLIYPERGHRLTKEALGDHFQECRISTDPIHFGGQKELKGLFEELDDELQKLEDRIEGDGDEPIALTKILRLRQQIELLKVPEIVEMIKESRECGNSVVVFLNFRESIDAISRRLTEDHIFIQGGQSENDRNESIRRFQVNEVRVALCNIAAGGTGVSLHDKVGNFHRMALISPTYNAKDFHQTLGRIDRLGGMSESIQRVLVAQGTLETTIVKRMMEKIENIRLLHADNDVLNTETMTESKKPEVAVVSEDGTEHAVYSPSSLKYVAQCPGYKPELSTNEAAEMGTRIHNALETGDWSKMNDYESSLAQGCRNAEAAIFKKHGMDPNDPDIEDLKEVRLKIKLIGHETFGTCDRLLLDRKNRRAIQIDYKTGLGKIDEPLQNWQGKAYGTGTFQEWEEIDKIDFYFIACRRDEILYDLYTRDMVPEFVEDLSGVIQNAKKVRGCWDNIDAMMLSPQTLVCNYCANAETCPAVAQIGVQVAEKYAPGASNVASLPEMHGSNITDPEVIAELLDLAPILTKAISGWKRKADEMVFRDGVEIPGYETQERSGRRSITSALAAYGVIKDMVNLEDFLEGIDKFPVTKYEKLVSAHAPKGEKKERVREAMAELAQLGALSKTEGSRYLAKKK
ncbi:MAG: DUF2800 domain-containing protein [Limisphaerales bacterium]